MLIARPLPDISCLPIMGTKQFLSSQYNHTRKLKVAQKFTKFSVKYNFDEHILAKWRLNPGDYSAALVHGNQTQCQLNHCRPVSSRFFQRKTSHTNTSLSSDISVSRMRLAHDTRTPVAHVAAILNGRRLHVQSIRLRVEQALDIHRYTLQPFVGHQAKEKQLSTANIRPDHQ